MSISSTVYPDWVQKYRTRGTTVKKNGNSYYLYKRTSKRVPGKKYPQPVDTYIGVVTKDGVVGAEKKLVSPSSCVVREYGFSKVIQMICPDDWKKAVGKDWKDVLTIILTKNSVNSYLSYNCRIPNEDDYRMSYKAHLGSLYRRISNTYNVDKKDLERLKLIYIVYFDHYKIISKIQDDQKEVLDRLGISDLEVD